MFSSRNAPPPPPPSYNDATNYALDNRYNTQYSDPVRNVQPLQPQSFSQPHGFGPPPYPSQQPTPVGVTNVPPYPVGNQQNVTTLPGQAFGQPPAHRQQPPKMGASPFSVGNQRIRTSLDVQQQGFTEAKRQELQRQAIIAMVCFFPLGFWAWTEYQRAVDLYSRGNVEEGKKQEQKVHKISMTAKGVAVFIVIIIVFSYFNTLG